MTVLIIGVLLAYGLYQHYQRKSREYDYACIGQLVGSLMEQKQKQTFWFDGEEYTAELDGNKLVIK